MRNAIAAVTRLPRKASLAIYFLLACLTALPGTACAVWDVQKMVALPYSTIRLFDKDKNVISTVSREHAQNLWAVKELLEKQIGIQADLYLIDAPTPNAFALSRDGRNIIGFTLPMFQLYGNDRDVLGAIMGHELAHLVRGHSSQSEATNAVIGVLGAILGIALETKIQRRYSVQGLGMNAANLASQLVSRSFNRDQEREADRLGLQWMTAAGLDPNAAVRFWERMLTAYGDTIPLFSTHPSTAERISNIRTQIASAEVPARVAVTPTSALDRSNARVALPSSNSGSFAALAGYSPSAKVIPQVKVTSYDVGGATPAELRSELSSKGIRGASGRRFDTYTTWHIEWKWQYNRSLFSGCSIGSIQIELKVEHTFPNWINLPEASPEYAARWAAYIDALRSLHSLYQEHGNKAADEIFEALPTIPAKPDCAALNVAATELGTSIIKKYSAIDEELGRSTGYGRTLGAIFPY
ncbi:MAG: DUF922 domain-containing protein [Burkholderiales bacterium]